MKNDTPQLQINKTTQKPLPKPKHIINSTTKQKNTQVMPNIAPHHNCASSYIVVWPFQCGKLLQCSWGRQFTQNKQAATSTLNPCHMFIFYANLFKRLHVHQISLHLIVLQYIHMHQILFCWICVPTSKLVFHNGEHGIFTLEWHVLMFVKFHVPKQTTTYI
jgi:hypothetical protein